MAFALYCVLLGLVVWGGVPSLGLFLQASMGADYTGHGGDLLAAMPAGITAVGLTTFLLLLRARPLARPRGAAPGGDRLAPRPPGPAPARCCGRGSGCPARWPPSPGWWRRPAAWSPSG
ncbi:hypothetical protein GCM10020229_55040 [Kitasatospora albolonga]|uniref:hypothetical protein n=1 Tax=Kitasatospora albolonga TaxID=68173 RepID=UPI0031EDCBBA